MSIEYKTTSSKVKISIESGNIIVLRFTDGGTTDEEHLEMAEATKATFYDIRKENPNIKNFLVLVDLSKAGVPTAEARNVYIKTLSDASIVKTAFFGAPSAIQAVVSFIVSASGRGEEVKFFVNETEAREWLVK